MKRPVILITGAAGAIGGAMAHRIASAGAEVHLLRHHTPVPASPGIAIHQGELTKNRLGLSAASAAMLRHRLTGILHCGATTRFSVLRPEAERINVNGTENLLRFARECSRIDRIGLLSTTYVAGKSRGSIAEEALEHRSGFVNEYERSKYRMEQSARRFGQLPIAVYRLSTILGCETGEVVRWGAVHQALRLFFHGWIPMVPGERHSAVDLISLDYATSALEELFLRRFEAGTTCHIAAGTHASLDLAGFLALAADTFRLEDPHWSRRRIEVPPIVPLRTFRRLEDTVKETKDPFFSSVLQTMSHFAPQLAYPKIFETEVTAQRLAGTGLRPAPLRDWLPSVLRYCLATEWNRKRSVTPVAEAV